MTRKSSCPQCGCSKLSLIEEHCGIAEWDSREWSMNDHGGIVLSREGWAESTPTGRWFFRCEECDHQWTKRTPTTVVGGYASEE